MPDGRVTSELLLVGSLPADSTETRLRAGAGLFGDLVFALPDGETGPRAAWVGYERERLARPNPDVGRRRGDRLAHRHPAARLRDAGLRRARGRRRGCDWDAWPRIDDAIESYAVVPARCATRA